MEITGKIHLIGETQTVGSAGTFRKRTLVVKTDEQYIQSIPIDFVQDKCEVLDKYKVGDDVTVGVNVRGNEYNGKFYVSLNGWKINSNNVQPQQPPATQAQPQPYVDPEAEGDLPF
jgi:hypothetical protein